MLVLLLNVTEAMKDAVHVMSLVRVDRFPLQGIELVEGPKLTHLLTQLHSNV